MNLQKRINIPDNWYRHLQPVIESDYFTKLSQYLKTRRSESTVYPYSEETFEAFKLTPFDKVRVVIIGMDPYPNEYKEEPVACGLAFAPRYAACMPPSLKQIYFCIKERIYANDLNFPDTDMNLYEWAEKGVFLLNAALTVEKNKAGSHLSYWKPFTEAVIKAISDNSSGVIFCFWGKDAQQFAPLVNGNAHHKLLASQPVSASYKGKTWECDHFEEINKILLYTNGDTIQWLNF